MSVAALVHQVGQVLGRGHALFGDPPASGASAAGSAGATLGAAADLVATGQQRITALSGALPDGYTRFAADAAPDLDHSATTDTTLAGSLRSAAATDRGGQHASGAVIHGAAADTAALAPATRTAAGQRALIGALRQRLLEQQQVIQAHQAQDARLAAMMRSAAYSRRAGGGGMSLGAMPFGGGGGGGFGGGSGGSALSGLSGLSGLSTLGRLGTRQPHHRGRTVLASDVDVAGAAAVDVPGEPGQGAVRAALSKLGRPYVWGAKGPSVFDCSGLAQWAWRQAGVRIGGNTYDQITDGIPVPHGQVRAGDLIFPLDNFGEGGRPGPGHVQLAISSTEVVHAPCTGDVVRVAAMPQRYVARRPVRVSP